jgi:hypothetical protein
MPHRVGRNRILNHTVRLAGAAAVVMGVVGTFGMKTSRRAVAQTESTGYTVSARSDTLGLQLIAAEAPVVSIGGGEVLFATPSSAQSSLDSLGASTSYASAPYPGSLVVSLPGTLNGLGSGMLPPAPAYPLYVTSSFPTAPAASQDVGPYGIHAQSSENATDAEARIGVSTFPPQVLSVTSHTSVARDSNSQALTATAVAEITPFSVSNVLRIGDIQGTASATYDPSANAGKPRLSSSLSIGTITVAGVELGLTDKGLTLAGRPVLPVDLSGVVSGLATAGLQLEYVPGHRTDTSITSAGVRITYQKVLPNLGLTTVRLVLGQVSATADPGQPVGDNGAGATGDATSGTADTGGSSGPTSAGSPAALVGGATNNTPALAPVPAANQLAAAPTRTSLAPTRRRTRINIPIPNLWSFYPIMAVGGIVILAASRTTAWLRYRSTLGGVRI